MFPYKEKIMGKKLKTAMIILAAGESKRMGVLKQILPWKNTTLLGHAIEQGINSNVDDVFVVLGAHAEQILKEIDQSKVKIVYNQYWKTGMGTSLACAIHYFDKKSLIFDAVLITLADQPLLDVDYYDKLLKCFLDNNKNIVASKLKNRAGVPAIFKSSYFNEFKLLNKDYGARKILISNAKDVYILDVNYNTIDVDTMDTYNILFKKFGF